MHPVRIVFLVLLFQHVHQHQFADHRFQVGGAFLVVFLLFQHALDIAHQLPDVLHALLTDARAGGVLHHPALVIHLGDQFVHRLQAVMAEAGAALFIQPGLEGAQLVRGFPGHHLAQGEVVAHMVEALVPLGGPAGQLLQGGRADLPARRVDHAQEGVVVVRVDQQAQVAHQVLDLAPREKAGAAGHLVGNLQCLQLHLQNP